MSDFPFDPLLAGDWSLLDDETTELVSERMRNFDVIGPNVKVGSIRALQMPCFPNHVLCEALVGKRSRTSIVSFLYGHDGVRGLNGDSAVIHGLNADIAPDLATNALKELYLQFFCAYVHGTDGPFEILTSNDLLAPEAYPETPIAPPVFDVADGFWTAMVLYGRSLFRARFLVGEDGQVRMEDDEVLAVDVIRRPELVFDGVTRRLREEMS